jgi:hypothetical protein
MMALANEKSNMKLLGLSAIALTTCLWSAAAVADQRDDALSAIQRCTELSDQQARLACYDQASSQTRPSATAPAPAAARPVAPPAATAPARQRQNILSRIFGNAPRAPQTSVAEFGSESLETNGESSSAARIRGDTVNVINGRMANYVLSPTGVVTVTLDNSQVWRQIPTGTYAHLAKPAASYGVSIGRGSFGSYKMTINGLSEVLDVRRIR